ncbi:hypothetical protein M9458_051474, partial [Cirrhinus mrigala]
LCVPPCKRYITSGDMHSMCVVCLGAEHAMSALEGADCLHCELLPLRVLRSRKALFEEGAFSSVPQGAGRYTLGVRRWICWREWRWVTYHLSSSLPGRSDAHSEGSEARIAATSSQGTGSSLHLSSSEEGDLESADEEPLPQSPQYKELLEVVTRAVQKLNIEWPAEEKAAPRKSKLDERFLRSKPPPPTRSLPFFPDLHAEISRSWGRPFSARLFVPASDYYGNVVGLDERAYKAMPRVEQTLASYLSPGAASSLKAPTLPSKPLRTTSSLVGKGYAAAGQAGACLHTMSVLQVYQADLLKGLADGEKNSRSRAGREQLSLCTSSSVATRAPPSRDRDLRHSRPGVVLQSRRPPATKTAEGSPYRGRADSTALHCVHLSSVPSGALQGTTASDELDPVPDLSARARSGTGTLVTPMGSPAGPPLQGSELAVQPTPEASLERLVPLVDYLAAWKLLPNVSAWVLRTVENGYTIQFGAPPPPFDGVFPTLVGPKQALVMEQEVETLLRKEAIEVVPPQDRESGFYSRYFIVPKKDGGLRPIIDLRRLNRSVMKLKFRMLTVKQVVSQIRSEDWFVTIDLKDAYFHVSILPQHRKFLRFAFRGEAYQYRVLPFGLELSPRTFTKCVDAALVPLRLQGIRILNYIDDWLILTASESLAARHRDVVLAHMKALGLRLNAKKSVLSPSRRTTYLGVVWDSTTMQARLSPAQIERVKEGRLLTAKQFQQLLGLMAAASNVIPFGLLYMRPLQWWLKSKGFSPRGNPLRMIKVTHVEEVVVPKSGPGIGSSLSPRHASDRCIPHRLGGGHEWLLRQSWHINCLEMLAVFRALKYFLPDLRDRHVLVRTDSTAVVYYINHQGGLRSRPLYKLAHQILVWSQDKLLSLRVVHIPGHLNVGAGILSRQGPRPGEWMLHPEVVEQIWEIFGPAQVDLFATRENTQFHPAPLGLDAMVQTWPRLRLFGESSPGRGQPTISSPVLAGPSMVLEPDISPRRLSMGDSRGGHHSSPPPGAVEAVGVASEGAQLIASGLTTEVVETILQKLFITLPWIYLFVGKVSFIWWFVLSVVAVFISQLSRWFQMVKVGVKLCIALALQCKIRGTLP